MSKIIYLHEHKTRVVRRGLPIVEKTMDGKIIECIDIDALSPLQRENYFLRSER
jgi:hypothetical protein